jgi:hypothetical protein
MLATKMLIFLSQTENTHKHFFRKKALLYSIKTVLSAPISVTAQGFLAVKFLSVITAELG